MSLGEQITKYVTPHHRLISGSAYLAAFTWLSIFCCFDRKTEIEEHGLVVGYASPGFKGEWDSNLREAIRKVQLAPSIPEALESGFSDAELIWHSFDFAPHSQAKQDARGYYTVASSRRGDSREALVVVLATPWSTHNNQSTKASWGVGIGLTLAKYFKTVQWLSKDVFFVFIDSSLPYGSGARAWLKEYFGGSSAVRRGVLRQAIVLDLEDRAPQLLCDVEGINGMLPNQDLVNSYVIEARKGLQVLQRDVWESVYHHFQNGGVHANHAPFLEAQVPAFTVLGRRFTGGRQLGPSEIAISMEGVIRACGAALQQLHHSFNFYFYTALQRHVSSGIYLYPVFAMQLPLLSFLMTSLAYRDVRSLLLGLGSIASMIVVSGGSIFLLGSAPTLVNRVLRSALALSQMDGAGDSVDQVSGPAECVRAPQAAIHDKFGVDVRRAVAASWLLVGFTCAMLLACVLRRYAFTVFDADATKAISSESGVRLPNPLWEAVRAASGFAYLCVLAPVTIYSWSVAVPLTIVSVPMLVLARPCSFLRRPVRSLVILAFLAGNAYILLAPSDSKVELLQQFPSVISAPASARQVLEGKLLPELPPAAALYTPVKLLRWLETGALLEGLTSDLLIGLYEAARDFNCVGGMLFPTFCFAYWPLLAVLMLVGIILPAQRVDKEDISLKAVALGILFLVSLLLAAVIGGVVWRSYSSSGLGKLQW